MVLINALMPKKHANLTSRVVVVSIILWFIPGLSVAGDPFVGNQVYQEHCVSCHGASGKAVISSTPDFSGNPMLLAKPDMQLRETILHGRNLMPAFVGILKEKQIMDVISYIRTFH